MGKIESRFSNLMFSSILVGFIGVIVGLLMALLKFLSVSQIVLMFGALVLINGFFYIIRYLYDGLGKKVFAVDLIFGVATIILGAFMMTNYLNPVKAITLYFAIWMFILFCNRLYYGIKFTKKHEPINVLILFIAFIYLIMGIVALINPFKFMLVTKFVGVFVIGSCGLDILVALLFKKRAKSILEMF